MAQILIILALVVTLIFGIAFYNETASQRAIADARADAIRIEAKAEARVAVILALLPWGITAALAIPATILALKWQPRRVVEQRVILQIEPGVPRRELWQALAAGQTELLSGVRGADETKSVVIIR